MLGAPKEYIDQTLREYVKKLKDEGKSIVSERYEEAIPQDKLFSNFVELELAFEKPAELLSFCFESMPSSVEIVEPEALAMASHDLTGLLCDLQARLHEVDMVYKTLNAKYAALNANATNVFFNFVKQVLAAGPKTHEELSKIVGVEEKELLPFLKEMMKNNAIRAEDGKFVLVLKA